MRGLGAATAAMRGAAAATATRHTHLPASYAAAFSSFSGIGGGGGFGRGRGRGSGVPPSEQPRAPGRPIPDDDGAGPASGGQGRGEPVSPSAPTIPSFSSFFGAGRGRGSPVPPPDPAGDAPKQSTFTNRFEDALKQPTFINRFEDAPPRPDPELPSFETSFSEPPRSPPSSGAGRGTPRMQKPVERPPEENRFIRRQEAKQPAASTVQPNLSPVDAVKRALKILGHSEAAAGRSSRDDGGRGGRGRGRGHGRGRGSREEEEEKRLEIYLGDKADGERLEKRLGEDKMKVVEQAITEAGHNVLPHPVEDAYLEACHTNNMIEFEPEYHLNFGNPDIEDKPPMSLEQMLKKVKQFVVAYDGIQNEEEWEEAVKDVMSRAPHLRNLINMYSGPDVVTAKKQEKRLQKAANALPENAPSSVKRFTDKLLLSLQNNPGWNLQRKTRMMRTFVRNASKHYN